MPPHMISAPPLRRRIRASRALPKTPHQNHRSNSGFVAAVTRDISTTCNTRRRLGPQTLSASRNPDKTPTRQEHGLVASFASIQLLGLVGLLEFVSTLDRRASSGTPCATGITSLPVLYTVFFPIMLMANTDFLSPPAAAMTPSHSSHHSSQHSTSPSVCLTPPNPVLSTPNATSVALARDNFYAVQGVDVDGTAVLALLLPRLLILLPTAPRPHALDSEAY